MLKRALAGAPALWPSAMGGGGSDASMGNVTMSNTVGANYMSASAVSNAG